MAGENDNAQQQQQQQLQPQQPQQQQVQTPTQTPHTPTAAYTTTQWTTAQIPIDPALQQQSQQAQQQQQQHQQHATTAAAYQHYQAYASHYPQATYATHYPYAPQQMQQQVQPQPVVARQATMVAQPQTPSQSQQSQQTQIAQTQPTQATSSNGMDTADIATLNDALGSAGVDLRAEEESLQRTHDQHTSYRSYEDRTRKQPPKPAFDTRILGTTMRTIGTSHKVTRVPEDAVNYVALALRARLQDLVTSMIAAAHHRTDSQFDRPASLYAEDGSPMWSIRVRNDVARQLAALEKIEREEETRVRRERKERADMAAAHAATLAASSGAGGLGGSGGGDSSSIGGGDEFDAGGGAKKKRKKEMGPGVTAKNMSEDVRKKMSNAVATQAAGLGGKYAWMTAANAGGTPVPKKVPKAETPTAGGSAAGGTGTGSSWARPYVPTKKSSTPTPAAAGEEEDKRMVVTMRDAMFVVEKERGHGGGKGAARGWV